MKTRFLFLFIFAALAFNACERDELNGISSTISTDGKIGGSEIIHS